jgi:dTDP-4-amino-4,6-dideoxygalactose transaminase
MNVPFVDLAAQHLEIDAEVRAGFDRVLSATDFVQGAAVSAFEHEYADFSQVGHCVGVGNGTDAIELALRALGVGWGDEVVLPANTFVATAEAVVRAGATPVFADVDPEHLLLDVEQVAAAIGPRTRALLPVHLYGQQAAMEDLAVLAADHGLFLVEDAAQAQGALRHGKAPGRVGNVAATSFYPGKNLGAYGDAGAVVTDDAALADRVRRIANHGSARKYEHSELGVNSRLDTFQAVVLRAKLARLAMWNESRRSAARIYDALLAEVPEVRTPRVLPGNEHVWHLYVVRVPERDRVLHRLGEAGVGAGIHYPVPVPRQPAFRRYAAGQCFPVTDAASDQILSLPMHPHLSLEQQQQVVAALIDALSSRAA